MAKLTVCTANRAQQPGTPLTTSEASRRASPAHTACAKAAPWYPQGCGEWSWR
jgi:hypothetical protein